jgi:16S rRNA G1207 methylase RsmC
MDSYFKKGITYSFEGKTFEFGVTESLFSTFNIDHGTDILLRSITHDNPKTILDLGCGYGPLGIMLASKYPESSVTLTDRDLLAVRYSQINIERNNIKNATVLGSLGFEQIKDDSYDLIVSNIPAKIGEDAITSEFFLEPTKHLNVGGTYWFVIVTALNHLLIRVSKKSDLKFHEIRKRRGHIVYKFCRTSNTASA